MIAGVVLGVSAIAGVVTLLVKKAEKSRLEKQSIRQAEVEKMKVDTAERMKLHAEQMASNPEYVAVHNRESVAKAELRVREEAQRAEAALIRQQHYDSAEAVAQRERTKLLALEESLIRERDRQREREIERMERLYTATHRNHCTCACDC